MITQKTQIVGRTRRRLPVWFAAAWVSLGAMAGTPPAETVISADHLTFDYRDFVAIFAGNVEVIDPQFAMRSDHMIVYFEGTNDVRQVKATGNVRVFSEDREAECNEAFYTKATEEIIMIGNASLRRGADIVRGDRITIWLNDERIESVPGVLVIAPGRAPGAPRPAPRSREP